MEMRSNRVACAAHETELLAGWGVDRVREVQRRSPVVVDLCTGSGAIALAVAAEAPAASAEAPPTAEAPAATAEAPPAAGT